MTSRFFRTPLGELRQRFLSPRGAVQEKYVKCGTLPQLLRTFVNNREIVASDAATAGRLQVEMTALDCNGSSLAELMDLFACKETGGVSYSLLRYDFLRDIHGFRPIPSDLSVKIMSQARYNLDPQTLLTRQGRRIGCPD